ncbi:MAG TPA: AAA family ATPase [Actinomycetota bacterium]|nr:AAA family ATPase [Actinomycetota bacterium]
MASAQPVPPLDLHGFLGVLRRRSVQIAVVAGIVVAVALAYLLAASPRYRSGAQVEVLSLTVEVQLQPGSVDPVVNMDTEAARVTQGTVAGRAASKLGLDADDPSQLEAAIRGVEVTVRSNTTYLDISCSRSTPEAARACASAFAAAYVADRVEQARDLVEAEIDAADGRIADVNERILELELALSSASPGDRRILRGQIDQLNLVASEAEAAKLSLPAPNPFAATVSSPADLPGPSRDPLPTLAVAAVLGLLLGVGIALVRERLAEPVVDRLTFAAALIAPVLAEAPDMPGRGRRPEPDDGDFRLERAPADESYRVACGTLLHLAGRDGDTVFALAGIEPGDTTRSAVGLAVALSERGKRVVALSSDPRAPALHRALGVEDGVGMAELLTGETTVADVVTASPMVPALHVIASGTVSAATTEPAGPDALAHVVEQLRRSYDFVVMDTPALSRSAAALSLVALADGVIVVAVAERTLMDEVESARHQIAGVGGRVMGGILRGRVPPRGWFRARPQPVDEASRPPPATPVHRSEERTTNRV